jgi:hypothetical protein
MQTQYTTRRAAKGLTRRDLLQAGLATGAAWSVLSLSAPPTLWAAATGQPKGFKTQLTVSGGFGRDLVDDAQSVQGYLKDVDIDAGLRIIPYSPAPEIGEWEMPGGTLRHCRSCYAPGEANRPLGVSAPQNLLSNGQRVTPGDAGIILRPQPLLRPYPERACGLLACQAPIAQIPPRPLGAAEDLAQCSTIVMIPNHQRRPPYVARHRRAVLPE